MCVQVCVKYHWKNLDKGYNLILNLALIESLHKKLWASKVTGVLSFGILKFSTWGITGKVTFEWNPRGQSQKII